MVKVAKKRLIDVDALRQTMESNLYWGLDSDGAILDTIDDAPIVDAVEVVHGHWFLTEVEYLNCSVCGEAYYTGIQTWSAAQDNLKYAGGHKFCPNCGAKMDGDKHGS